MISTSDLKAAASNLTGQIQRQRQALTDAEAFLASAKDKMLKLTGAHEAVMQLLRDSVDEDRARECEPCSDDNRPVEVDI